MINIGTVLHTKDGRKVGNAIVVQTIDRGERPHPIHRILTDFGNEAWMTEREIRDLFHVRKNTSVKRWLRDREAKREAR